MAGHGSTAGLMAYGDANAVAMEIGEHEVLPVVDEVPVICGVHASDPRRRMWHWLGRVKEMGFSGVNNFPTHCIVDGQFRQILEETGMSFAKEVEMIGLARRMDLFTIVYVATPDEARAMAAAGGIDLAALVARRDRGECVAAMAVAAAALVGRLVAKGRIQGAIALGGGGGTAIASAALRPLPIGFPKLVVSTLASGNTTVCIEAAVPLLEAAGYEVRVFHATGTGGRALETLVASGLVAGVLGGPGGPFHDPAADAALFQALESGLRLGIPCTSLHCGINDPAFASAAVEALLAIMTQHSGSAASPGAGGS
jgi:hypothetical protein